VELSSKLGSEVELSSKLGSEVGKFLPN
jgi:hypothetical protein